jgi:hypothetical protein
MPILSVGKDILSNPHGVGLFGPSITVSPVAPTIDLVSGLLAYWPLNEVSDGSGLVARVDAVGSNHLYDTKNVSSGAGKIGAAAQFNSVLEQNLGHQSAPQLNLSNTDFTISGWFYLTSKDGDKVILSKYYTGTNQRGYRLAYEVATDRIVFRASNNGVGSVGVVANNFGTPTKKTCYFLIFDYNFSTGEIALEINRRKIDRETMTGGIFPNTARFYLGRQDSSQNFWDGLLDDIAIHTRLLNNSEKDYRYNNGSGNPITIPSIDRGIIHVAGSGKTGFTQSRVPFQRSCFYSQGLYWLFYAEYLTDDGPYNLYVITSADGVIWSAPTLITDIPKYDAEWTVVYDPARNHVHVGSCIEQGHTGLKYRRGTPQADGSIVWAADWQIPWAVPKTMNDFSMCVTSDGHVWVSFGWEGLTVLRNANTDGTWTDTAGFPLDLYHHGSGWCGIVTPNGADSVYVTSYLYGQADSRARGYAVEADGTFVDEGQISELAVESKSGEKAWVGRIEGMGLGDGVIHIVYQSASHDIRYLRRNADGSFEAEVQLSDSSRVVPAVSSPRLSFSADGDLYVIWTDTASRAVWMVTNAAGSWSAPVSVLTDYFDLWYEHLMPAEFLNGSNLPLTYLDDGYALKWKVLAV